MHRLSLLACSLLVTACSSTLPAYNPMVIAEYDLPDRG